MFGAIASRYDRANTILSGGIHHLWRRRVVRRAGVRAGERVLDCATGTITADQDVFTIAGVASDVDSIRVRFAYATAASPPTHLTCSVDSGSSFKPC